MPNIDGIRLETTIWLTKMSPKKTCHPPKEERTEMLTWDALYESTFTCYDQLAGGWN